MSGGGIDIDEKERNQCDVAAVYSGICILGGRTFIIQSVMCVAAKKKKI